MEYIRPAPRELQGSLLQEHLW